MPWLVQTVQFLWCSAVGIVLDRLMTCPVACRFFGPCTQVHGWAVYTGTRPGFPRHQGGKGWRGRRELAPRCSATRISCILRTRLDRHAVSSVIRTTHTTHTPTHHTTHHTHHTLHTHHTHHTHTTHMQKRRNSMSILRNTKKSCRIKS